MNKFLRILLVFTILFTTCISTIPDAYAADNISWSFTKSTSTLYINGDGDMSNYDTSSNMAPWLAEWQSTVKKVVISDGITGIGNYAFYKCTALTTVSMPDTIETIGRYAFRECSAIKEITIPVNVTSIGDCAFYKCTSLATINFNAKNCTTMGSASLPVFNQCTAAVQIKFGDEVKRIPDYAFEVLTGLTTVTIPDTVSEIGQYAFYKCTGLKTVAVSDKTREIQERAFYGCTALESINTPRLLTTIGDEAFSKCSSIVSLTLSPAVTNIGHNAFSEAEKLILTVAYGSYAYEYADVYGIPMVLYVPEGSTSVITPTVTTSSSVTQLNGKLVLYVNFDKELTNECVHIAFYNASNKVVDYLIVPIASTTKQVYLVTNNVESAAYTKIFVWDSMETCMPVSKAETIQIVRP